MCATPRKIHPVLSRLEDDSPPVSRIPHSRWMEDAPPPHAAHPTLGTLLILF
jgi:hypothetical protein